MTDHERSDRQLLAGLPEQPELIGVLYERHAQAVFRFLSRRAGPAAAEDLLSEVFVAALQARGRVVAHDSAPAATAGQVTAGGTPAAPVGQAPAAGAPAAAASTPAAAS